MVTSEIQLVQSVKFDVAVTVEEGTETKGGIGIFISAMGLAQGQSKESQATVGLIQFEIPGVVTVLRERAHPPG